MSSFDLQIQSNQRGFCRNISAPKVALPPGACDSHMHIVGPFDRYPLRETRSLSPPAATLADYVGVMHKTGIERNVVVQPSFFAKDNACTLDAVEALAGNARAVVVIDPDISEDDLAAMHSRGARGVRVQRVVAGGSSIEDITEIAARVAPFGWHLQLFIDASDLPELQSVLSRLPVDVVFDHMAVVKTEVGMDHPGFKVMLDLLQSGRGWVKLANAFSVPDATRARILIETNVDQVLWGSDWPHVGYQSEAPDDGALLDALLDWSVDESTRNRILVDNPNRLYFS